MKLEVVFLLSIFYVICLQASPVMNYQDPIKCRSDAYPPEPKYKVATEIINLDVEPEERWKDVVVKMKPELLGLLQEIKNFTNFVLDGKLFDYVNKYLPSIITSLPDPYGREIKGISSATGIPLGEVLLYNVFYEVFTVCTSIVAETPQGKLFHARNLDFGLLLGWDDYNNTWALSEKLRPLVVNFEFQKKGKTVYFITGFAGFVGAITGMKPGFVSLTMNERFNIDGGYIGILEWILGNRDAHWVTFLARDVLESTTGFEMAKETLTYSKILAPCYFILGGNSSGQGVVITRDREKSSHPMSIDSSKGIWYVLQTNYDNWKQPLIIDDRRTPGKQCMNEMTQQKLGVEGLFNVLSSIPVLNKLTTYTVVMQVNTGEVVTYRRFCRDPCFPW